VLTDILSAGSSIIGNIAGSVINSQAAKKAAKIQAGAQEAADLKNQETLSKVTAMQAPGVAAYYTGLNALTGHLGLPTQGVASAINNQTAQRAPFDATQYLKDHPDVLTAFQQASPNNLRNNLHIDPTPEAYATWFYNTKGQYDPNYQLPAIGPGAASPTGAAPAPSGSGIVTPAAANAPTPAKSGVVVDQPYLSDSAPAAGQSAAAAPQAPATNALTGSPVTGAPGSYGNTSDPTYTAPAPFSYTQSDYQASPALQYQLDQASKQVLANASATGALKSGAALKSLSDRAQDRAYGDFASERQFAQGNYQDQRNTGRAIYENDRNYLSSRYDQGTNDLFRYTGVGQNALNTTTNAAQGYGADAAQTALNYGNIAAGNALQQGSIWSGLVTNLAGQASNALGGLAKPPASAAPAMTGQPNYNFGVQPGASYGPSSYRF
jgi:hypothetical protein